MEVVKVFMIEMRKKIHIKSVYVLHCDRHMMKIFHYLRKFLDLRVIVAMSSTEPRCIISMAAFSEALKEYNPRLELQRHATPGDMNFIAFHTQESDCRRHTASATLSEYCREVWRMCAISSHGARNG